MAIFDRLMILEPQVAASAALNMAIDEAVLEWASRPVIRFYKWARPAISFGYFGKFEDVAEFETTHDLVRRWTGGGIVFHEHDLTYSLVIPTSQRAPVLMSNEIYQGVHSAVRDSLTQFSFPAALFESPPTILSESCFARPVRADVMVDQTKVAGAAHRRTKKGILHQGSIQNLNLPEGLPAVLAGRLSKISGKSPLPPAVMDRASILAATKYGTPEWLKRR